MEQPETAPPAGEPPKEPEQAPGEPAAPPQGRFPTPLPEPKGLPIPDQFRLPFHGKTTTPTAVLTPAERMNHIQRIQKARRRRGFIIGLLVGQLLILLLDYGGELALKLLPANVRLNSPIPLRALVFIGMTAGIVFTALLIFFVLGLQGAGWVIGKKKVGFFAAVGRGMKRSLKAAWAVGLSLGVIGGTAWFMIPRSEWKPTADYLKHKGEKAVDHTKTWVRETLKPKSRAE